MRILVFGEAFLPPAYTPRLRYFCSYFAQKGWNVDLVTEHSPNMGKFIPDGISVLSIIYYKNRGGKLSKIEWLLKFLLNLCFDHKGRYFYRKSRPFIDGKQYDLVFCNSSITFPLTTAVATAKDISAPLFVDLRDIAEQAPTDNPYIAHKAPKLFGNLIIDIYKSVNIVRRNKVLKKAKCVTTVSPWHVKVLSQFNQNTHLIYNGFDESMFKPELIGLKRFTISYFGQIYNSEMQNPALFFDALRALSKKNILTAGNTVVRWFSDKNTREIVQNFAKKQDLEGLMEYYDYIKPEELSDEMNASSILLVLRNTPGTKKYLSIMTTKFFEAIGVNRPILCVPDNKDNLTELFNETHCGLISSEASEVEQFLTDQFEKWQQAGHTKGILNEETRMKFSRRKGAEILENLFLQEAKSI